MHLGFTNRFWRVFLAGSVVIFGLLLTIGSELSKKGIDKVVQLVATSQLEDWAAHITEKHPEIIRHLHRKPLSEELVAELRREAELYGISTFTVRRLDEKLGKYRLYAHNSTISRAEIMAASNRQDRKASHVHIRTPIRDARGREVAELDAIVDQKRLYAQLVASMRSLLLAMALGIMVVIALAWFTIRNMHHDSNRQLEEAQSHDRLTGLPNHQAFSDHCEQLLAAHKNSDNSIACMVFGVDNLGRITCAQGHEVAGHVLRTLASRFARVVNRYNAHIFRLERDDFAIVLPVSEAEKKELIPEIISALKGEAGRSIYWRGKTLQVTLSIGMSLYPDHAVNAAELARQASLMQQAVREAGGNDFRVYEAGMDREYHEMLRLERLLRRAARNCASWFEVVFQPIVNLQSETLHGFEALLRLRDAEGKPVSPALFVPLAERLNLMDEIGAFVLEESCRVAAQWPDHLHVSVNLSPLQFQSGKLAEKVAQVLAETGLKPRQLELEITESLMMETHEQAMHQLEEMKAQGVRIVLDDFGTGYSSMSYLWQFPFDKLKIDRSFTVAIGTCHEARSILRSLVVMARSLKLPVVVEGIETAEQAAYLRKMRCNFGQGYYFGKPMAQTELANVIMEDWRQRKALKQLEELQPHARELAVS